MLRKLCYCLIFLLSVILLYLLTTVGIGFYLDKKQADVFAAVNNISGVTLSHEFKRGWFQSSLVSRLTSTEDGDVLVFDSVINHGPIVVNWHAPSRDSTFFCLGSDKHHRDDLG